MARTTCCRIGRRTLVLRSSQMMIAAVASSSFIGSAIARAADVATTMRPAIQELLPAELHGILKNELPAALRKKSELVMATDVTIGQPYTWMDKHSRMRGLTIDMAEAIGYLFGLPVKIVNASFDTLIPSLQSGRFDFSIADMLDTRKREKVVDFVDYLLDGSSLLVRTDSALHGLDLARLCGLSVAVLRGSVEEGYVTKQTKQCEAEGEKPIHVLAFQGNNESLLAVVSGRADVMMGASAQLSYVQKFSHGKVRSGGKPIGVTTDGIAVPKGRGLTKPIQLAVQKLMDSGIYARILALYGVESSGLTKAAIDHAIS